MSNNLPYKNGIVRTKDHPELKFGQVVIIVESTPDLYRVKLNYKGSIMIISKEDLVVTQ
jgi:hypothetical protein